jgi:hypothetical protein
MQVGSATQVPPSSCVPALQLHTAWWSMTVHSERSGCVHGLGVQASRVQPPRPSS